MPSGGTRPSLLWVNQFALLPKDGGGTRAFELGRELVKRGWSVDILASDFHVHKRAYSRRAGKSDHSSLCEEVDGVRVHWLWAAPYQRNDWRRVNNWVTFSRSVRRWRSTTVAEAPSLVIGSSPQLLAARAAYLGARALRVPFILEVRDLWPESVVAAGGGRGAAYLVFDRIAKALYRDAEAILVLARGTGDYLVDRGIPREKIMYVPNGVDVTAVRPPATRDASRPFTLVYAGAHGPANGLEAVLDAAECIGEDAGVRFLLVGDGPAKAALREDAERRGLRHIHFVEQVSKPELVELFASADAGLMVLREAPLFSFAVSPNKLFDYLAAALPVVCNVPGDVARMVEESGSGVQAADASGKALAHAVQALKARGADERARMGDAGRTWVTREHSREVLGMRLDGLLREAIGS